MWIVGLTGGIGSGKSAVADGFARLGVPVIDTDVIARELTAPGGEALAAIRARFGDAVFDARGELDRAALRRLAFSDPAARRGLEHLLHPRIRDRVRRRLSALHAPYAVVVVPLLAETGGWRDLVQRVLLVECPEAERIERVKARSGLEEDEVRAIIAAQATDAERRAAADDRLDNAGSRETLNAAVADLHARYLERAGTFMP